MGPTEELAHFVVNYPASEIPDSIITWASIVS
jgi:hypothetical protein